MPQVDTLRAPQPSHWVGVAAYAALLALGIGLVWFVCRAGADLTTPTVNTADTTTPTTKAPPLDVVLHVMATLVAVIVLGTIIGRACRWIGQPPVIGEVIAGIVLGPSLLGLVWPEGMHFLIPSETSDPKGQVPAALRAVSQIGVVLYMFLVGLELNAARLRKQAHVVVAVSHASIVLPFVLGSMLALALYGGFAPRGVPFSSFALFLGVAMSITAFPVLARILTDHKMERTELGTVALGCAAADDVTAWCLLALIIGVSQSQVSEVTGVFVHVAAYLAIMFLVVRPLVSRLSARCDAVSGPLPSLVISGTFIGVLASALATEAIGIHALFGAFLFGVIVPHDGRIAREFTAKLKDPVSVLFLPAFFAYTGMRTEIGLVSSSADWLWCAVIVLVATLGKFGGATLAARVAGQSWRDSAALGVLMNTRGLMELIVLNIGLDRGVLTPTLFAMMVIMALVTTATTSPLVRFLTRQKPKAEAQPG